MTEKTKVIKTQTITYIAEDGKEFLTKEECIDYEKLLKREKYIKIAEKYRIKELDNEIPLDNITVPNENNTFRWYRVENTEQWEMIGNAYGNMFIEPRSYPEIVCIETIGSEAYLDYALDYHMTTCKEVTQRFWNELGYEVIFKKK